MGGGGRGGPFSSRSPAELSKLVRSSVEDLSAREFETSLAELLNDVLAGANSRDHDLVSDRLDEIKDALDGPLETSVDTLFGGSVAKHTYVDGLSDVDSLVILNDSNLENATPANAIARVANILRHHLDDSVAITTGKLAVSIEYQDGMQIQILPAFRHREGLKVPSFKHDDWSGISPEKFQDALTKANQRCGGKLVPTIKLAKSAMGQLPESQRLSGYHVESLAIDAFKNYSGPNTVSAMLPKFFEHARSAVLKPIVDSTGQSVHVDRYLGPPNSDARIASSHILSRIAKRMRNASAYQSKDQWSAILGEGNG